MRKIITSAVLAIALAMAAAPAIASCTIETVLIQGQMLTCQICCVGGTCTRNCW